MARLQVADAHNVAFWRGFLDLLLQPSPVCFDLFLDAGVVHDEQPGPDD